MWRISGMGLCFVLAGCGLGNPDQPLASYANEDDRSKAAWTDLLGGGFPEAWYPCRVKAADGSFVSKPTAQCFKMTKSRRFQGVWRNEFEGSLFCEGAVDRCDYAPFIEGKIPNNVWLSDERRLGLDDMPEGLYQVALVGRKTLVPGSYGHMGMNASEIVVDKMIAIKRIGDLPPRAELG